MCHITPLVIYRAERSRHFHSLLCYASGFLTKLISQTPFDNLVLDLEKQRELYEAKQR
jgi:hypothetical protein